MPTTAKTKPRDLHPWVRPSDAAEQSNAGLVVEQLLQFRKLIAPSESFHAILLERSCELTHIGRIDLL